MIKGRNQSKGNVKRGNGNAGVVLLKRRRVISQKPLPFKDACVIKTLMLLGSQQSIHCM